MAERKATNLEFYGGPLAGFLPILIYMAVAVILSVQFQYYSINAIAYGGVFGLLLVSFLARNQQHYWRIVTEGVRGLLSNFILFIFLGLFIAFLTHGDLAGGVIWLGNQLGLQGGAFVVLSFIASALVAMGTGTPLLGLLTILPLFYPSGIALGANGTMLAGAILSGCFFGDHISPNSQVTIISSQTQKDDDTGWTADSTGVIRDRAPYVGGAALFSVISYYFLGSSGSGTGDRSVLDTMSNATGLWMLAALLIVLVIAFKTKNALYGLVWGSISAATIGLATGLFNFNDLLRYDETTAEMAGIIPEGVFNLSAFLISLIFLYSMIEVMNRSGAMAIVTKWLAHFSILQKPLGVEFVISLLLLIGTIMLSGMVIPAILIVSTLMNSLGKEVGLNPIRRTNIMILASTSISPLIPIGSVYLNGTVGNVAAMQAQFPFVTNLDPFAVFFGTIYNWLILAVVLAWMFLGVNRKKK